MGEEREAWAVELERSVEQRGLVVIRFNDSEWEALKGLREFTVVRPQELLAKVRRRSACLLFRRRQDAGLRDEEHTVRFGLVASKAKVATLDSRIKVERTAAIMPGTRSAICELLKDTSHARSIRQRLLKSDASMVVLPPKMSAALVDRLLSMAQNRGAMRAAAMALSVPRRFSGPPALQWDAVETAKRVFGLAVGEPARSVVLARGEDTELARANVLEDGVIEHDARYVPGYDLVRSGITGRAEFANGNERLVVYTANRRPLERVLGVDLVYLNETQGNVVMLQYKMLEAAGDDWIYRTNDEQFERELSRMQGVVQGAGDQAAADYRITPQLFYLKFVKRNGNIRNAAITMPLDHYQALRKDPAFLGPNGGHRVSFEALEGRYLRQGPFVDLVRSGYIGAHAATSVVLKVLVEAVVNGNRAAVAAIQSAVETPVRASGESDDFLDGIEV